MPRQSDSRQRMLDAAARLLRRQGYAATGWRQVVADGGAPWGSQAHFFPGGKEQLASEALAIEGARMHRRLEAALAAAHPADMVLRWARNAATQLEASDWSDGCPIATTALETAHQSDALAEVCNRAFAGWGAVFVAAMGERGVDAATAQSLATLVLSATEGALLLARTARDAAPLLAVADELAAVLRDRVP